MATLIAARTVTKTEAAFLRASRGDRGGQPPPGRAPARQPAGRGAEDEPDPDPRGAAAAAGRGARGLPPPPRAWSWPSTRPRASPRSTRIRVDARAARRPSWRCRARGRRRRSREMRAAARGAARRPGADRASAPRRPTLNALWHRAPSTSHAGSPLLTRVHLAPLAGAARGGDLAQPPRRAVARAARARSWSRSSARDAPRPRELHARAHRERRDDRPSRTCEPRARGEHGRPPAALIDEPELRAGRCPRVELTQAVLDRIDGRRRDQRVHHRHARAGAGRRGARRTSCRARGESAGPLHGMPDRAEGQHRPRRRALRPRARTGSSPTASPTEDAEVTRRLRAAGAVIVGQDHAARVRLRRDERQRPLRAVPQPVGPRARARRLQRRLGRRASAPTSASARSAPTPAARCASRPR